MRNFQDSTSTPPITGYLPVNGLQMYYEIHGTGEIPLVLLHGGISAIGTSFGKVLPSLAQNRQVIAVEQQGYGHTADIDRPLTTGQMAEDTVALLHQLCVDQADFFGYSMGGGIAMHIALHHPDLVRKFIFAGGASYSPGGFYPEVLGGIDALTPEILAGTPWAEEYARIAPHPENWPRLLENQKKHDREFKGFSQSQVQSILAPALIIIGDADIVRPEHTVELFRLLGGGVVGDDAGLPRSWLAILPGTTHITLVDRLGWLVSMIEGFLDAPPPQTK